jgi:DNA polymerase I-like protein with 3'-5' exonuclease and polymerase domains
MKQIAVDIETTGLDFRRDEIVCITVRGGPGCDVLDTIIYYPSNFKFLAHIFANPDVCKVFHNAAFDVPFLIRAGLPVVNFYDTMVGEQLVTNGTGESCGLTATLGRYNFKVHSKELQTSFKKGVKLTPEQVEYCKADVEHLCEIKAMQERKLNASLVELEMKTTEVLIAMSMQGIRIKRDKFEAHAERLSRTYESECKELQKSIAIDWRNPNAVKKYFAVMSMEELIDGLEPPQSPQATLFDKTGDASVCLSHWLKVRKENYLPGVNNFFEKGGYAEEGGHWRFHVSFKQNLVSGRIATRTPNLQGLDGDFKKYIVPDVDHKFVIADFGAQELGIAAHLSQDKQMLKTILDGHDLHSSTAQRLWPKQWEKGAMPGCDFPFKCHCKDHLELRSKAKTIMFGLMYGLGKAGLCKRLSINMSEATKILEEFRQTYPRLTENLYRWSREPFAKRGWGYSPKYNRPRFYGGTGGAQGARNSPVQTTGAEMLKLSMIRLHEVAPLYKSQLLLPVHDEIITQSKLPIEWLKVMEGIMNQCADELTQPGLIKVEIKTSDTWK